jgi:predicted MPP superfamily phosphohydrolase
MIEQKDMVDKKVYKRILCISDLHAPYNHPDSIDFIRACNKAFKPDCVINMGDELDFSASSYHESSGIARSLLKPYNEMLGVSNKWTWHDTITLNTPMGLVYFVHQQSSNVLQVCAAVSMNVVQAHYHTKACIHYTSSPEKLMWAMNTGCLIDKNHLAFKYSRVIVKRPILSLAVVENGIPKIVPMVLKRNGEWDGKVHL